MQQLEIEHKKSINNSKVVSENKSEESINKREASGQILALTRKVLRIVNSDTFYCHSESKDVWYFIRYESSFEYCSCLDQSMRHIRCKHLYAVEYSIRKNTLQEIEKLPLNEIRYPQKITATKDWRSDEYDF
jgi:hypothetical protein